LRRQIAVEQEQIDRLIEIHRPLFRHVFRNAYSFDLDWEKMSGLVLNCEDVWRRLEAELTAFVRGGDESGQSQQGK
jgi:hypothetical protein